jgi:hypothetical protein
MGGEYLPDFKREEVEIARVTLQSSTQDVISVRAKAAANRIKYRIVDEYETPSTISPASSSRPLSMSRLICLMDGAKVGVWDGVSWSTGVVWGPLTMNLENSDDPLKLIDFVEVTSEFYPQLGDYYADEIRRFLQARLEELPARLKAREDAIRREVDRLKAGSQNGNSSAMSSLGYKYFLGEGVEHSVRKAISLWEQAADLGKARGMFNLAVCFHDGIGVKRDEQRALELYERVAEGGYYLGLKMAAFCRRTGIGCEKSIAKALRWNFEIAKGFGPRRFADGLVECLRNMGGASDLEKQAVAWIVRAARRGVAGKNMLESLSKGKTATPVKHGAGVGYLGDDDLMRFRRKGKEPDTTGSQLK